MERRTVMMAAAATSLTLLPGCTTSKGTSETAPQKRAEIDTSVDATLATLYSQVSGSKELAAKSRGILVFPSVISAGFWIGGQYGQGALRVDGQTNGYYSITAASFGLQIGAQSKAIVLLFMTQDALDEFRRSQGWAAGVDATVAVLKIGANGNVDTSTATSPVEAIVMTNAGLMAGVSLEGSKISRLII